MSVVGHIATFLLLPLVSLWLALFLLTWRDARRPDAPPPPVRKRPEISPERADEIVRSTTRWGWCKVGIYMLCLTLMYVVAAFLFWPVMVGNSIGSRGTMRNEGGQSNEPSE